MKIGFTGTQSGMSDFQKEFLAKTLIQLKCSEFVHGDCIGSDEQAHDIAKDVGVKVFTIFPPKHTVKRAWKEGRIFSGGWHHVNEIQIRWMPPDDYLVRNRHIVDNVEFLIACPKEFKHTVRSGTWATIRYAWKIKREISIIPPVSGDTNGI